MKELLQTEYSPDNIFYILLLVIGWYNNDAIGEIR